MLGFHSMPEQIGAFANYSIYCIASALLCGPQLTPNLTLTALCITTQTDLTINQTQRRQQAYALLGAASKQVRPHPSLALQRCTMLSKLEVAPCTTQHIPVEQCSYEQAPCTGALQSNQTPPCVACKEPCPVTLYDLDHSKQSASCIWTYPANSLLV